MKGEGRERIEGCVGGGGGVSGGGGVMDVWGRERGVRHVWREEEERSGRYMEVGGVSSEEC